MNFIFIALLLVSEAVFGQSLIGINGGYTKFFMKDEDYGSATYDPGTAFPLSVFYRDRSEKRINICLGLSYIRRTFKYDNGFDGGPGGGVEHSGSAKANHLYLFFYPEYSVGDKVKFTVGAGPAMGWMRSRERDSGSSFQGMSSHEWADSIIFKNQFEIRFLMNIGVEIPLLPRLKLSFDNSVSYGMIKIWDNLIHRWNHLHSSAFFTYRKT